MNTINALELHNRIEHFVFIESYMDAYRFNCSSINCVNCIFLSEFEFNGYRCGGQNVLFNFGEIKKSIMNNEFNKEYITIEDVYKFKTVANCKSLEQYKNSQI